MKKKSTLREEIKTLRLLLVINYLILLLVAVSSAFLFSFVFRETDNLVNTLDYLFHIIRSLQML